MNILKNILIYYSNWKIKNYNITNKRYFKSMNISDARKIGIIFDATIDSNIDLIKKFTSDISTKNNNIVTLGYIDSNQKDINYSPSMYFNFFFKKDIDFLGQPKSKVVDKFLFNNYDILINFSLDEILPLKYISTLSKSIFKVGKFNKNENIYDFTIKIKKNSSLEKFLSDTLHYLELIKNN